MSRTQAPVRRKRRSATQLNAIMNRFDGSGLSRSAFCRKYGVSLGTPKGVVHHSEPGSQYLSIRYSERLFEASLSACVGSV